MINQEELLANFIEESRQHLQDIEPNLLDMEKGSENFDSEVVNRVFRAIHSIKGAAGFFGLNKIGELSHVMENLLSLVREKKIEPAPDMIDALLMGIDTLKAMVEDVSSSNDCNTSKELSKLSQFLKIESNEKTTNVKVSEVAKKKDSGIAPKIFDISLKEIERIVKKGWFLYSIKIFLKQDLTSKDKTPYDLINTLASLGEFLDSFLDIESISGLSDCFDPDIAFIILFASLMEEELVPIGLEIPADRIKLVDFAEYGKQFKQKVPSSLTIKPYVKEDAGKANEIAFSPLSKTIEEKSEEENPESKAIAEEKTIKPIPQVHAEDKIRVGINILNDLVNLAGELVLGRNQLMQVALPRVKDTPGLNPVLQLISRITTEMQSRIMQMRMQPVSLLFGKFHRIVRDLAKTLNKEIKLVTFGEDVELDKSIIESLSDPLTHLIRNSIDHGIESPEIREKTGKTRHGTIELKAYHQAGQVYIEVNDDGGGINTKIVAAKALEKSVITKEQLNAMTEKEKLRLILKPGFSTAKTITSVSGRGVGMDVVITNIEKLGGTVDIDTVLNKSTNIRLILPLTLAIVSGLVIKVGEQNFIIPEANIEELVRITQDEIESRINIIQDALVLRLRDTLLPLIHLKKIMKIADYDDDKILNDKQKALRILVTKNGVFRQGIIVDGLENIEEIVVKPLPRYLKKMKYFSGASIMGNGSVALILDVAGIIEKANIHHIEETIETGKFQEKKIATRGEAQTLLLFDNKTQERFALPLELITRIERITASGIEHIKDHKYLQYQGKKLKLIFLEDYLPISSPTRLPEDTMNIIIPKLTKYPIGIAVNNIIGTINSEVELDTETIIAPGLFGSAVLNEKITLLPDMFKLFELAAPEYYGKEEAPTKSDKKDKYKILLVDDTAFFRMVESEYLISAGYDVIQAENGKKAISILEEQSVDAVILDIIMPELSGWEVIKLIRSQERLNKLPVMAVTSLNDEDLVQRGKASGFTDWETKLNKSRLLEKLKAILK